MSPLKTEVERVLAAGALGRSGTYIRLLNYLADATEEGRTLKEVDLATDVLGRADLDSVSGSTARVYVHNLRQKLEAFYQADEAGSGPMLVIPKGNYQLALEDRPSGSDEDFHARFRAHLRKLVPGVAAGVLLVAALSFLAGYWLAPAAGTSTGATAGSASAAAFASSPAWSAILDDMIPVTIVVGDYFVFLETEDDGQPGNRLIREFSINSAEDFRRWQEAHPEAMGKYVDIHLSYLPTGTAAALNSVLSVLRPTERTITVVPQSQFGAEEMRETHVIYVGYLSGMGHLGQFPFLVSRLSIGDNYDELVDTESGVRYESSAGPVTEADVSYQDFGYVVTFPGPAGNQFLYVTGMRDEGLMQMASILGNAQSVQRLGTGFDSEGEPAFEALYQVSGFERTYVAAKELFVAAIDASRIWMESTRN